jgi:hypothetical protein
MLPTPMMLVPEVTVAPSDNVSTVCTSRTVQLPHPLLEVHTTACTLTVCPSATEEGASRTTLSRVASAEFAGTDKNRRNSIADKMGRTLSILLITFFPTLPMRQGTEKLIHGLAQWQVQETSVECVGMYPSDSIRAVLLIAVLISWSATPFLVGQASALSGSFTHAVVDETFGWTS